MATVTGPQSGILARGTNSLAYKGLEPVTVTGAPTITINAPNTATVVLADSGTTTDKTFSVDFNAGGETHSITAADTVTAITLNLGTGTNNVTLNALDPAFKGTLTVNGGPDSDTVTVNARTGPGIYTFNGGGGTDTLVGPSGGIKWSVTGDDAGSADGATLFSDVENLTGAGGADEFTIVAGSISGQIDGGGGSDTLIGPNVANEWTLSGTNAGKLATTDFVGIENLIGGNANDTFKVDPAGLLLGGTLDGGPVDSAALTPPTDTLDYSNRGSPVSVNLELASGTAVPAFSRITSVVGSAGSTLTGPVALLDHTAWTITGANAGTVDGTAFSGFANLTGQDDSNDAFTFAGGTISGTIDGGAGGLDGFAGLAGANLTIFQPTGTDAGGSTGLVGPAVTFAGMDHYDVLTGDGTNRVVNGTLFDRDLTLTAAAAGQMSVSFANTTFTSGGSTFTFSNPSASLTLITGTGGDTITVASVDPAFSGALLQYSQAALTGVLTAVSDAILVALSAPSYDDGLVVDLTLNGFAQTFGALGAGVKTIVLDGLGGNDSFALDEILPIAISFTGGAGSDTLVGPDGGMGWDVTGADSGTAADDYTTFSGIENLTGGSGVDRFNVRAGGSISGLIDGGSGAGTGDVLIGPDADSIWNLTGADAGTLSTDAATPVVIAQFLDIENLTGGNAADTFKVGAAGSLSGLLDGGLDKAVDPLAVVPVAATDTLDYSAYGSGIFVNLALATATAIGEFSRIDALVGSAFADTLTGPGEAEDHINWTITGANAGEVEGTAFSGFENLTGRGVSSDYFLFETGGSVSGTVDGGSGVGTTGIASRPSTALRRPWSSCRPWPTSPGRRPPRSRSRSLTPGWTASRS